MTQIYLDNNATSFIDPRVSQHMSELGCMGLANPASQHRAGRLSLRWLESAKTSILKSVGAVHQGMNTAQIVVTSGGSEANNLALHSYTYQRDGLVIVGAMEHPSLLRAAELSAICLNPVRILPALPDGRYDIGILADWLDAIYCGRDSHNRVALVSLMIANNETGVLNDLTHVVQLCNEYQIPVHSDIVQAVGKLDFQMAQSGLASITIAAHKIHGPVGIGALIVQAGTPIHPMIVGGGQQLGFRAGTEPVSLTAGFARSLECAEEARLQGIYDRVAQQRDFFEEQLTNSLAEVEINGGRQLRVPQTSNLSFLHTERQSMQMALDLAGIACSTGSACSSGSSRPSASLTAMGVSQARIDSALRFSLSRNTTKEEIGQAASIIAEVVQKQRKIKAAAH